MSAAWPAGTRGVRLWLKLAALGAVAIVATHVVHLAVGARVGSDALAREQEALGRGIARLVAEHAADALLVEDRVTVDELAVRTAHTPTIAYCFIVADGEVVGTSLPPGVAERLLGLRSVGQRGPIVVADGGARYLDLEEPILAVGGTVRLGVDMAILQTTRDAIARPLWLVALGAIALSILIALVVGLGVTRPVEEIVEAADRFDPSRPLEPIRPRGGREIEALARRFNGMRARLRAAHEEQERVRARALANERLATLGSLVAGVAHEVNNPLASLRSAAALLREDAGDPAQCARDLELVHRALDQIEEVVRRLLDFGRDRPLELAPVSAALMANDAAQLARLQLRRRGIVVEELQDPEFDDAPVLADRKQVGQALLNLLLNAAFASRDFSSVRMRLRRRGTLRGIAVEDDGPGIPQGIRGRICDPFFSTKPAGQGTGLGLTVARTVADRHHGELEFTFPEAGGTIVTLWLPAEAGGRATEEAEVQAAGPTPDPTPPPAVTAPDAAAGASARARSIH